MNTSPKIDLTSIMKGKNTLINNEEKIQEETTLLENIEIEEMSEKQDAPKKLIGIKGLASQKNSAPHSKDEELEFSTPKPTISLSSIRTTKSITEIKENEKNEKIKKYDEKEDELEEVLENYKENIVEKKELLEKNEEKKENNNKIKVSKEEEESLEEIQAKIDAEVDAETEKKLKIKKEEKLEETGELFGNYKSDLEGKEEKIIKDIEIKRKNLREKMNEPKTRIFLVASLIILTAVGISGLFYLDPDNHSLEKYKVSILANAKKIKQTYIDKPWLAETINIENYSFNVLSQEKSGPDKNYKYKEIMYNSKAELDMVLNNEVQINKAEIARQEAERIKIEQERIQAEKEKEDKEKIKNVLLDKFR